MSRFTAVAITMWVLVALRTVYDATLAPGVHAMPPRKDFAEFPSHVLGPSWGPGTDVPLEAEVERKAGVSAYLQRRFHNGKQTVMLYVGYVEGAPSSIHYPEICFPSAGSMKLSEKEDVLIASTLDKELRFRELHWRTIERGRVFTLYSFYYDGEFHSEAENLRWQRFVGVDYFAIVIISGNFFGSEETTRLAYYDMVRKIAPRLMEHFPEG